MHIKKFLSWLSNLFKAQKEIVVSDKSDNHYSPGPNTRSIHHGESFAADTGTIMPPIFPSSTFAHGNPEGFDYTRSGNPNFRILESVLASIEDCKYATVFASGVSAITAVASTLKNGDLVLCEENLYGCTVRLFEQVFQRFGVSTAWVDFTDQSALEIIIKKQPAMIWLESPTNPLLKITDLKAMNDIAKKNNLLFGVDATFSTPVFLRPLEYGADLVMHSTTKYLSGHNQIIGGSIHTNNKEIFDKMKFIQKTIGAVPSPFDCFFNLITETDFTYTDTTVATAVNYSGMLSQELFNPIDVAGWQRNRSWINTNFLIGRWLSSESFLDDYFAQNQEQFRTLAMDAVGAGDSNTSNPEIVVRALVNKFTPKGMLTEADFQNAMSAFKIEDVPENYYSPDHTPGGLSLWILSISQEVPKQVHLLLRHIVRQPEFQLK